MRVAEHLREYIDTGSFGPKVCKIELSETGELNSVSSNTDNDETLCVHYPPLQELEKPARVGIIARSELEELERLAPNVDLVSYVADVSSYDGAKWENREAVFKYYFQEHDLHERWDEINLWMRLPPHPNIVPFDRLVVEELYGQQLVVGFTSLYIRGGSLHDLRVRPCKRIFKLKWVSQLANLVDDLNLRFGIEHQDIAARNLVVDEATDNVMLFDFNLSARIGGPLRNDKKVYDYENSDVKGVVFTVYEILTQDYYPRHASGEYQPPSTVLDLKDWKKHPDIQLDHPLNDYRKALDTWLKARKERKHVVVFTVAPEYIDWPPMREPSCFPYEDQTHPILGGHAKSEGDGVALPRWAFNRRDERNRNRQVIEWQRPASTKMREGGIRLFADGKTVEALPQLSRWVHGKYEYERQLLLVLL